jgi:G:T/U-mismatch repair DNA glycosylase
MLLSSVKIQRPYPPIEGKPRMTSPLLQGFPPTVDDDARVLILGSLPSALPLAAHQYYASPRNAFWPITSELFGCEPNASYERRQHIKLAKETRGCEARRSGAYSAGTPCGR